jgi:hypothetical protein
MRNKSSCSIGLLISLLFAGAVGWYVINYIWINELFDPPELAASASSWRSITPGQTSVEEAQTILGPPDEILDHHGYRVYRYKWDSTLHWLWVELWIRPDQNPNLVTAVYRSFPYYAEGKRPMEDVPSLEELIAQYGRPDKVTWSTADGMRYMIWAHQGIAAKVEAESYQSTWRDFEVGEIILFEPMGVRKLLGQVWPFPERLSVGWGSRNWHETDKLPEDPYDWDIILEEGIHKRQ